MRRNIGKLVFWYALGIIVPGFGISLGFSRIPPTALGGPLVLSILQTLAVAAVLLAIIIVVLHRSLATPLRALSSALQALSRGGNLTQTVDWRSRDEVGELIRHYGEFMSSLNSMLNALKGKVDKSTEIGENVETATKKTATLSREISDAIKGNKDMISSLNAEIASSTRGIGDIRRQIDELVSVVTEHQAASVHQSTAAIEEMVASIDHISRVAVSRKERSDRLVELAEAGSRDMEKTIEAITEVTKSAKGIMDVVVIIKNVASQINLLAMNAAIEAAHASESGRGFAVVAAEVRQLAETTDAHARSISKNLSGMMQLMQDTAAVTRQTDQSIRKVADSIKDVTDGMTEITENVHEVSAGSAEILKALQSLTEITESVRGVSGDANAKMDAVSASIATISVLADKNLQNATKMGGMVDEISSSFAGLLEEGRENAAQIQGIDASLSRLTTRKEEAAFVVGFNDVPPFSMKDERGEAAGAANAYLRAVIAEMGLPAVKFRHIQNLEHIYELLDRNAIDAYTLATRSYAPNPGLTYVVPARPSFTPSAGIVMKAGAPLKSIVSAADLKGLRIFTKNGMPLVSTMSAEGLDIQYLGGEEPLPECIRMMMKGRADAVYSIIVTELQYMAKTLGLQDAIKTVLMPDPVLEIFTAFSTSAAGRYLPAYQAALEKVSRRTPFDGLLKAYLG